MQYCGGDFARSFHLSSSSGEWGRKPRSHSLVYAGGWVNSVALVLFRPEGGWRVGLEIDGRASEPTVNVRACS